MACYGTYISSKNMIKVAIIVVCLYIFGCSLVRPPEDPLTPSDEPFYEDYPWCFECVPALRECAP